MPPIEKPETEQDEVPPSKPLRKRLISGAFWSVVGRVGSIGALFFSHVFLARELPKQDYAAYLIVATTVTLCSLLVTFGTPQVLIRSLRGGHRTSTHIRDTIRAVLRLVLMNCGLVIGLFAFVLQFLSDEPQWSGLHEHAVLVSLWFSLSAFCYLLSSALQGLDDFRSSVLVGARNGGVIPNVLFLISILIANNYSSLDLGSALLFQVIFFALSLGFAIGAVIYRSAMSTDKDTKEDTLAFKDTDAGTHHDSAWFFRESWPILFTQIIAMSLLELDVFWVAAYASESDIANYGAAKKLVMLVSAPLLMTAIALGPFVSELFNSGQLKRLERILRGSATVVGLPCLFALVLFLAVPQTIIEWSFGEPFLDAALPLRILTLGQIVFVASGCNGLTLTMTGHQRYLLACSMLSLVLYCLLAPAAISGWGAVGAAIVGSALLTFQNIIVSVVVKLKVGIWTAASPSPEIVRTSLNSLLRPKRMP